jgi:hypothetical protein
VVVLALGLSGAAGLASPPPAGAQYDGTPSLTCRPTSVAAGDVVNCEATGFRSNADVEFSLTGTTTTAKAEGAEGKAAAELTVADTAPEGLSTVTATGPAAVDGSTIELNAQLTIIASAPTSDSAPGSTATEGTATSGSATFTGPAPATESSSGSSTPWPWIVLLLLVVGGGVAVIIVRRRAATTDGADASTADDATAEINLIKPDDGDTGTRP